MNKANSHLFPSNSIKKKREETAYPSNLHRWRCLVFLFGCFGRHRLSPSCPLLLTLVSRNDVFYTWLPLFLLGTKIRSQSIILTAQIQCLPSASNVQVKRNTTLFSHSRLHPVTQLCVVYSTVTVY